MIIHRRSTLLAFTLVEVLVSMSVLALLVSLVAQLTTSATKTITGSRKHMDADGEARIVLDRLASDLRSMVKRGDVDCIMKGWYTADPANAADMPGNDSIHFWSESPGYESSSMDMRQMNTCTVVGYRINPTSSATNSYALERYGGARGWEDIDSANPPMVFLTYNQTGRTTPLGASTLARGSAAGSIAGNYSDATGTDAQNYLPIGQQAFRFEYCYLLKDGTFSAVPYYSKPAAFQGFRDVSALVVAIAVLDDTSRKIVASSNLAGLVAAFPDAAPSANGANMMAEVWNNVIEKNNFLTNMANAGIPPAAASQVRVYQRFFYLSN